MFVSTGSSIKIHRWPNAGTDLEYLTPPELAIKQISLCNDNSYLAYALGNKRAQIISLKDASNIHLVHTISSVKDVTSVCFKHFTKRNLALGTHQGDVLIYDTKLRSEIRRFSKLPSAVNIIEFTYDDRQIGVCYDNAVTIFSSEENEASDEFAQVSHCTAMKFHPSISNHLAVGCKNGNVSVWDVTGASRILNFAEHTAQVTGVALPRTSNILITSGLDYKMTIFNANNAEAIFRMTLHQPITTVDVSKDGRVVAAGLEDGSVYIYDLRRPYVPLSHLKSHLGPVNNICFENGTREVSVNSLEIMSNISTVRTTDMENSYADTYMETFSPRTQTEELRAIENSPGRAKNDALEKIRNDIFRLVKTEMDDLENQMDEHCLKFQTFLNNEFDIIQNTIREKWDIFNLGKLHKGEEQEQFSCVEE